MSTNLGPFDAPHPTTPALDGAAASGPPVAARSTRTAWRDPRLWLGVVLVAASVLVGVRLFPGGGDGGVRVWVAARDLPAGATVTSADLAVATVELAGVDAAYLRADDELPADGVLRRPVAAGELVPAASLGPEGADAVEVALWAPAVSVPDAVRPGSVVDVWVVPDDGAVGELPTLAAVRVVAAPRAADGLGPTGDQQVVVAVPDEQGATIGTLLAAAHDGRLVVTKRG